MASADRRGIGEGAGTKAKGGLSPLAADFQPDAVMIEEGRLPGASRWALYLLLVMLAVGVLWASVSEVDRVVTARGKMVTTAPTIVVQPMETAVVMELKAMVGQVVAKGAVLAVLDPTFTQAEVAQQQARLSSYAAQADRLQAELDDRAYAPKDPGDPEQAAQLGLHQKRRTSLMARMAGYREGLARLEASLATNQREQEVLAQRLKGLKEIEGMRAALHDSRHESKLRVLEAQNQRLEAERELKQAVSREAEVKHELGRARAERDAFLANWRQEAGEELIKARRERDQAAEQLAKAQRRGELVTLRSPAEAMVLETARRSVGSVVKEAEPLFTLVPLDSPLEAEVQIEARDIGFVRMGDQARIKLDAFPFQKHGAALGRLRSLSEDAVQQPSVGENPEEKRGGLYYLGRLTVAELELKAVPPDFRLLPGMTLSAEIKVGSRRVISYLLYPVIKGFDESLREP